MDRLLDQVPQAVVIPAGAVQLDGIIAVPPDPVGTVLFAHGSGSSRFSPRHRHVADTLVRNNIGALLFDLLTEEEELNRGNVFDISLLAERLCHGARWVAANPATAGMPIGYFGASTGAAAALLAAAGDGPEVGAVVSRGGRPDLAESALPLVRAPTLLIVGGADEGVLRLNAAARERLGGASELAVVPGATHLFEEPGALDRVARLAVAWFTHHLGAAGVEVGRQGGSNVHAAL